MNGLAVSLASRSGISAAQIADLARVAEDAGFASVFLAERCADSLALAHSALLATERITVGTAIANAGVRHPALTALTAATLAEESGGRFLLGLGVANAALNERVLGLAPTRPVTYMREYVGVLRAVMEGRADPPPGEYFPVAGFVPDRRSDGRVPVFLAALLPRMLALAGELADGVFLNLMATAQLPAALAHMDVGLARVGRTRADIVVACILPCCISDDADAAARAARQVVAGYAMHPAAGAVFSESGFADELMRVRELLAAGDENAAAAVSDAMIDALIVHGRPGALSGRIRAYREAGVDLPVLFPMPVDNGWTASMTCVIRNAAPNGATPPQRKDVRHV